MTAAMPYAHLGEALATDYLLVREQFSDEQWEHFIATRRFVDTEVLPAINEYWERAELPWPLMRRLAELGVVGEDIEGYGCPGMSPLAAGLVNMELHRGDGSLGTFLGVQSGLAMKSIAMLGSEEQRQRWLPRDGAARDDRRLRADRARPRLGLGRARDQRAPRRRRLGDRRRQALDRQRLRSRTSWSSGRARTTTARSRASWSRRTPRASRRATIDGKGATRAIWQADVALRRRARPAENRLPEREQLQGRRPGAAATRSTSRGRALGHAVAAYDTALTYSKQRTQFGKPLCSFQIVQDRLVKMLAEVTAMQLYCMQLARLEEAGRLTDTIAGLAKINNTRKARQVIAEARDLLGGNGVLLENHVIRHMGDIEVIHTYEGTETMQTLIVGRDITGVGAFA